MSVQSPSTQILGPEKYIATAMVTSGDYLISSWDDSGYNSLVVWKKNNQSFDLHQQIISPHANSIKELAIEGKWLASISRDKTVKIWKQNIDGNFEEHQSINVNHPETLLKHYDYSVQLLGGFLFTGHYGCQIWKMGKEENFEEHQELVSAKEITTIGAHKSFLWISRKDNIVEIFKKFSGDMYKKTQEIKYCSVKSFAFNSNYVAGCSRGVNVKIWVEGDNDMFTQTHFLEQNYRVSCLVFKENALVVGMSDGTIQFRKRTKDEFHLESALYCETDPTACAFLGDQLLMGIKDTVKVWNNFQSK